VFATTGARHEATSIVDTLATERGWLAPPWYRHLKDHLEPQVATDDALATLATVAGLDEIEVSVREVDAGLDTPDALIRWRLSGPAIAPFVNRLDGQELASLWDAARRALGSSVQPFRPAVRILSSVAPATR
jgi:hypothetical protein